MNAFTLNQQALSERLNIGLADLEGMAISEPRLNALKLFQHALKECLKTGSAGLERIPWY